MSRVKVDLILLLVGLIWGFGFVSQKDASAHLGPFTFVACRFLISSLFVLPLMLREGGLGRSSPLFQSGTLAKIGGLCATFVAGVNLQQYGTAATSATNAAFLSGTNVVMVPFAGLILFRDRLSSSAFLAGGLSLAGVWLLTGADVGHLIASFNRGDAFMLLCAVAFALQMALMGHVVGIMKMPFTLSFLQYVSTGAVALVLAMCCEPFDPQAIASAWMPILYSGVASGGIAYTLQAVAQQHTPTADSAIILSSEALFGALGGAWLLHEKMGANGYIGCAAIIVSIFVVELAPFLQRNPRTAS